MFIYSCRWIIEWKFWLQDYLIWWRLATNLAVSFFRHRWCLVVVLSGVNVAAIITFNKLSVVSVVVSKESKLQGTISKYLLSLAPLEPMSVHVSFSSSTRDIGIQHPTDRQHHPTTSTTSETNPQLQFGLLWPNSQRFLTLGCHWLDRVWPGGWVPARHHSWDGGCHRWSLQGRGQDAGRQVQHQYYRWGMTYTQDVLGNPKS